ncbi:MAG: threonine synthase [Bacteroidota bacterium]
MAGTLRARPFRTGAAYVRSLDCMICGEAYPPEEAEYVCPKHGHEGILDVTYDYARMAEEVSREEIAASRNATMWRYRPLLPIPAGTEVPPLRVGWTPLYRADRLARDLGLRHVWIKDDGQQPTASLKDRASAMAVVQARARRAEVITTASSGNAAAALSGLCASVGQPNVIFVPEAAPPAKIAQVLAFGSTVMLVEGTYDEAFELCLRFAERYGWYNRNTGFNPYMSEGKKTVSYEICEQLGWEAPDAVVVSVGDGCILGGVHKGFHDLYEMGWIGNVPRLIGVQAQGSAYLAEAWAHNEEVATKPPIPAHTVADSINVGLPRDRMKAMRAVRATDGGFVTVLDQAILEMIPHVARLSGVFAEPAGATAFAGLHEALRRRLVAPDERVVVLNTGNGLKDITGVQRALVAAHRQPLRIAPDAESMPEMVGN